MCIGYVTNNDALVQKSMKNLAKGAFPKHYVHFFDSLYKIYKGDPKTGLKSTSENLGVPHEFLLQFIVAISKQDNSLIRYALNTSVDQIFNHVSNEGVYIDKSDSLQLKNYFLSIYAMSRGSEFNIEAMVKRQIPQVDPVMIRLFYKSSQGLISKFDRILDALGIITQKKVVIEFSNLLFERDADLPELAGRLGIYPENSEIFHAAVKLMVITSKFFIKTLPQLNKLKTIEKGNRHDERTQMTETLIITSSKMKKYLGILYRNKVIFPEATGISGKVMKLGSFIRELFYDITGDDEYKRMPRYKNFDKTILKEQISAASGYVIQKVLKGDQSFILKIMEEVMEFLEFKAEKRNYFKSLCYIITSFVVDMPTKDNDDIVEFQMSFKMTSMLLELDEDLLAFVLDILSGNPYRIFQCLSPNPRIDLKTNDIVADFVPGRLGIISDIFKCNKKQVKKLAASWIHSYDLVSRGENSIKKLGTDVLKIDPMYFHYLIKKSDPNYRKTHHFNQLDFSEAIRKFIDIQIQRLKMNKLAGKESKTHFFDDLRIEKQYDYGDDENPGLDNLPSYHPLVDSPFEETNGRSKEDVLDFMKLMESILYIKEGEVKTFQKIFNVNECTAKTLSVVYKAVYQKELDSLLTVLINLSKKVEIKMGILNSEDTPNADLYEENQNQEIKNIEKTLTKKDLNQSMFLQFMLLFTGTKLNTLLTSSSVDKYKMMKKLNSLFFTINKFLPESQKLVANDIDFSQVFPSLFESGFFKKISKYFFHVVTPITKAIKTPESIFGVIVGLSLQNKNLIRNSLVKLVGSEIKKTYLNGIFGFIVNDPSLEKDMRAVMKKININSNLGLSLVELITDSNERDKYNAALSICKNYCTAARRVSALVALFKKDLSNIRIISERIDVDTDIMSAVLACATKRLDLLNENFKILSFKLGINNTFAFRSILSIGCGDKKEIENLKEKKNKYFHIQDKDLLDSIMFLTHEGTKMRDEHTRFDIKDSTFACQNIYDSLKKVFGITKSRNSETGEGAISDIAVSKFKSSISGDDNLDEGDDSMEDSIYEGNPDFDLKDLMDVDDPLLSNIQLLVDSCWNDGKSMSILSDSIVNTEKRTPGTVNSIWAKFPEKGIEILMRKLRGIYDNAVDQLAHMEGVLGLKIKENMKYMKALEAGNKIEFEELDGDEADVIGKLNDNDAKTAYKNRMYL